VHSASRSQRMDVIRRTPQRANRKCLLDTARSSAERFEFDALRDTRRGELCFRAREKVARSCWLPKTRFEFELCFRAREKVARSCWLPKTRFEFELCFRAREGRFGFDYVFACARMSAVRIRTVFSRAPEGREVLLAAENSVHPFGCREARRIRTVFSRARRSVRIRLCFRVREDVGVSQQSCSCMPSSVGNSAALRGAMRDRTPSGIAKRVERPLSQTRHVGAQRVLPPSNRSSKTLSNSSWSPTARAAAGTGTRSGSGLSALRRSLTSRYPGSRRAIFWK